MKRFLTMSAIAVIILGALPSVYAYDTVGGGVDTKTNVTNNPSGTISLPFVPYEPDTSSQKSDTDTNSENTDSQSDTDPFVDEETQRGDADNDGQITSSDALMILRASVGLNDLQPNKVTDVDNDGFISANDALLVLRKSVGLSADF